MHLDRPPREWFVGTGTRSRLVYLLSVIGIALVINMIPDDWVSAYIWLFAGFGFVISALAGAGNYGVLTGLLGTAPYVAMVGQAAFLGQPVPNDLIVWVTRGSFVLFVATAGLLIPGYLVGVGVRIAASRRP